MSSFTHGLALDGVTVLSVTLANSTTVRTTPTARPDLYWALLGAGSSFEIVSEFEFETFEPPEELTHSEIQLEWDDVESVVEGWLELQSWGEEEMPREMNLRFGVNGMGAHLDGLYHGGREEAEGVVLPLVERLGGGEFTASVTWDWMGLEFEGVWVYERSGLDVSLLFSELPPLCRDFPIIPFLFPLFKVSVPPFQAFSSPFPSLLFPLFKPSLPPFRAFPSTPLFSFLSR